MEKTALITGASSGIGYEFARLLAADCRNLILVARNEQRLKEIKKELEAQYSVRVFLFFLDLSQPDAAASVYEKVAEHSLSVDLLVNNAGFGTHGSFAQSEWQTQQDMISVNVTALTQLTRLFLPGMIERRSGAILNVASTAAFQPGPFVSVYYASKAFVLSFTEAIASELRGTGVTATALCPGPTATGFGSTAGMERTRLFRFAKLASPRDVARYGYRAMKKRKAVSIYGWQNKISAFSTRFAPRKLLAFIVRSLHKEVGR